MAASLQEAGPIIDVRAPAEYHKGHIPGAISLPLFEDAERAEVGTLYKQTGRQAALLKGLELVGPKLASFVTQAHTIAPDQKLRVHCWRGGMRSESMGLLWEKAGFKVSLLQGGYKAFRQFAQTYFARPWQLHVLSGPTGSGKTAVLEAMAEKGAQIIDLEGLAQHKGSAFGGIGLGEQPSTEHFENLLCQKLMHLDPALPVWVEDESVGIGRIFVPLTFYEQMQEAEVTVMEMPRALRIQRLVKEYAQTAPKSEFAAALIRIKKRLGDQRLREAQTALEQDDFAHAAELVLAYYDRAYEKALQQRASARVHRLVITADAPEQTAQYLLDLVLHP